MVFVSTKTFCFCASQGFFVQKLGESPSTCQHKKVYFFNIGNSLCSLVVQCLHHHFTYSYVKLLDRWLKRLLGFCSYSVQMKKYEGSRKIKTQLNHLDPGAVHPPADCFFFRARTDQDTRSDFARLARPRSPQPSFKFSPSLLYFEHSRWQQGRAIPVPPPRFSLIPASKLSLEKQRSSWWTTTLAYSVLVSQRNRLQP